ncbi:DUF1365 domain-containing protein [Hoeflea marina]
MHQRMRPIGHRFRYRVFSLMVDLDQLPAAGRLSPLFSVNRANLVSFFERDHLRDSPAPDLRSHIDGLLARAGLARPAARVLLACYPRILGHVFNPLSVYYAYDEDDRLTALVYEVRNTFGEHHSYVCPVLPGEASAAGIRQSRTKIFYVSPFLELGLHYLFRMNDPGEAMTWRILETDADGPVLAATYSARRQALTTWALGKNLLRIPFLPLKIIGGIHWEALRLWLKGVRLVHRPPPPGSVSYRDETGFGQPGQ